MSTEYTIVSRKMRRLLHWECPRPSGLSYPGKIIDQLLERMEEAIPLWLEVEGEEGGDAPIRLNW